MHACRQAGQTDRQADVAAANIIISNNSIIITNNIKIKLRKNAKEGASV